MSDEVLQVLQNWPATRDGATARRITSRTSFSGAAIWRIVAGAREFALRRWEPGMTVKRLQGVHDFQQRIADLGPPGIPKLQETPTSKTFVLVGSRLWELASWVPGEADRGAAPRRGRIQAAMRTLAAIHNAAVTRPVLSSEMNVERSQFAISILSVPTALRHRQDRLTRILQVELNAMTRTVSEIGDSKEREIAGQALNLITTLAPTLRHQAAASGALSLPLQRRLGDARREHFLFTGDEVTGVVDFGAVDFDSPAGDVARLLGGLAGTDRQRWAIGLAAYEELHPLTDDERRAVDVFDSTGTAISAANWIHWLFQAPTVLAPWVDRAAAVDRLRQLVERLRVLAG